MALTLNGEKIRFLLATKHKTARELSKYLDISNVQISRWQHDVKPVPKVHHKKIAEFFDISVEELLGDVPSKEKTVYDMIEKLSKDERLNLIVYIANSLEGAK